MQGSLQNTYELAAACCTALSQATSYRDAQRVTEATVEPKYRKICAKGPDDQLWQEIDQLYRWCRCEPKEYTCPEDYSLWYANLYRFAKTALSIRTLLTAWAGIEPARTQSNIKPENLLETREPEKDDFPKASATSALEQIGSRTLSRLQKRGLTGLPPWTYEKYRGHFLYNPTAHKRVIHVSDFPQQVCGFYSLEIDRAQRTDYPRREKRYLGAGVTLETAYTPPAEMVLRRIGFDEIEVRPDPRAAPIRALREEVALKIALCLTRDAIDRQLPLRLPA